jgi:hypothetical protein
MKNATEHVMTITGMASTERAAWQAEQKTQKTWKMANAALWAAIFAAVRDGATIQVAHDSEEGMVDAHLYIGELPGIAVNTGEVSEYGEWLEYAEDGGGFGTYVWNAEKSGRLLDDLIAEAKE